MKTEKFTISLTDLTSIRRLQRELEKKAKKLKDQADEITRRLSIEAANEASKHFSEGVMVESTGAGVLATGDSVVFEEFGAGSRISDPFPGGADVSFEIRRGAYSDLNGGEYAQSGYQQWHYGGEVYEYITPGNGLFYASETVKDHAAEIAEEVLKT